MNFQNLKVLINLPLLALTIFALSCTASQREYKVIEIFVGVNTSGHKNTYSIESDYILDGEVYSLRAKAMYNKYGTITKLLVYKSEGIVEYDALYLRNDPSILDYFDLPLEQNWLYNTNKGLVKDSITVKVVRINNNLIKENVDNMTIFYKLESNL